MFKPVSLFVGLRYTRTRRRNFFVSFVSIISMLGVCLGVVTLIVVLSVINGSTTIQRDETLKSVPHAVARLSAAQAPLGDLLAQAEAHDEVLAAAPYLEGEAWVRYQGQNMFVRLRGVDPERELAVVENDTEHNKLLFSRLAESDGGIILGTQLAGRLRVYGNASLSVTPLRSLLRRTLDDAKGFDVIGTADFGFYGNENLALISLEQARELFAASAEQQLAIRLRVTDIFAAKRIAAEAFSDAEGLTVTDWSETQSSLFNALQMEKVLTGFMLLMIVIVGAVNIVSTLVMVVADKGADIAILRTMGASRRLIMSVFIIQGSVAGLIGTSLGAVIGVFLAQNVIGISVAVENAINRRLNDSSIYLISHLKSQLIWSDVALVCLMALLISFLATLYPAWRATKIQPAEVLRYE